MYIYFINHMIAKWTCNQLPTALVQSRWGKVASSSWCPRCQTTVETSNHVLRCSHTQTIWDEGLALLQSWLSTTHHTKPELHDMLLQGLETWRTGDRNVFTSFSNPKITLLFYQQVYIGWSMLLMGFVSKHIVTWQSDYHSTIASR